MIVPGYAPGYVFVGGFSSLNFEMELILLIIGETGLKFLMA